MSKHTLLWGAFDAEGNLRARFDSESEAHFYIRNRGHMHGGSYRAVDDSAPADLLAALEECITDDGASAFRKREYAHKRLAYITALARAALAKAKG